MRKVVLSALCAAALLTACNNSGQNKSTLQAQNDSLMLELSNRDTELDEISEKQQCDVVVVTENSLDGKSAQDYADDFFDYNGYVHIFSC